jgi:hypothetical protein
VGKKNAGRILDGRLWDEMPRFGGTDFCILDKAIKVMRDY